MDNILVSCVVPVYKVDEKYLRKCIESLMNQTLKKIEIILVDDNNDSDQCSKILEEYKNKDSRIIVIHEKNKGLAGARNSGTKIAKGRYITYIDGDDYIDKDGLERLFKYTKEKEFDVIRGQFYKNFPNREIKNLCGERDIIGEHDKEDIFILKKNVLNFNAYISSVGGALYRSELIKKYNIYNDEKLKQGSEDVEFSFRLYDYAKSTIITNEFFYHYIYNDKSISANSTDENNYRVLKCFEKIGKNIQKQPEEKRKILYDAFNVRLLYVIVTTAISRIF